MGYIRRGFFVLNSSPTSSDAALQAAQNTPNSYKMREKRKIYNSYIYKDTNNNNEKIHSKQLMCFMLCHHFGVIFAPCPSCTHSFQLSPLLVGLKLFLLPNFTPKFALSVMRQCAGQDLSHLMDLLNCFLKGDAISSNMENSINKGIAPLSVKMDRSVPDRLVTVIQFLIKINQLLAFLAPNYCHDICFKKH